MWVRPVLQHEPTGGCWFHFSACRAVPQHSMEDSEHPLEHEVARSRGWLLTKMLGERLSGGGGHAVGWRAIVLLFLAGVCLLCVGSCMDCGNAGPVLRWTVWLCRRGPVWACVRSFPHEGAHGHHSDGRTQGAGGSASGAQYLPRCCRENARC